MVVIESESAIDDHDKLRSMVGHLLRFDEDFDDFYRKTNRSGRLAWIADTTAGRLLRSATVWEDLVKTICTTNCSWAMTRIMVGNLVEQLGRETVSGRRAFPDAEAMASMPEAFYCDQVRAGYRSGYFVELAELVAGGELDPEAWLVSGLETKDLKKLMKSVKGVGDYAAENLLKLVGRYDGLALDSWLRARFYEKHTSGKRLAMTAKSNCFMRNSDAGKVLRSGATWLVIVADTHSGGFPGEPPKITLTCP